MPKSESIYASVKGGEIFGEVLQITELLFTLGITWLSLVKIWPNWGLNPWVIVSHFAVYLPIMTAPRPARWFIMADWMCRSIYLYAQYLLRVEWRWANLMDDNEGVACINWNLGKYDQDVVHVKQRQLHSYLEPGKFVCYKNPIHIHVFYKLFCIFKNFVF